jgi:hypothetical protein
VLKADLEPPKTESEEVMKQRFNWKYYAALAIAAGMMLIPGVANAANCAVTPSFTYTPVVKTGGQAVVGINTAPGCLWEVVSNTAWIKIVSANRGYGSGSVVFQVLPNTTGRVRRGSFGAPTVCDALPSRSSTVCTSRFTVTVDENGQ